MKLYICGNGFDLHHKLATGYEAYAHFLHENYPHVHRQYKSFPYLTLPCARNIDITPWSDIENSLTIQYDDLMANAISEGYPDVSSDTDSRWSDMAVNMEILTNFVEEFTGHCFYEWVSNIDYSQVIPDLQLPKNGLYLTFNYTDTLQSVYEIPDQNILHVHGAAKLINSENVSNDDVRRELQFGSSELIPVAVSDELESQYGSDDFYGVSIEPAIHTLIAFIHRTTKDLQSNYSAILDFLQSKQIDEITVMGHTLCQADLAYYTDVLLPLFNTHHWTFMRHGDDSSKDIQRFLQISGLKNYKITDW